MRNNFWFTVKVFSNIMIAILNFTLCSPFIYRSSHFVIAKVVTLNLFTSVLYRFWTFIYAFFFVLLPYSYRNNCRSFSLLKAIPKSKVKITAIARKSNNHRKGRSKEILAKNEAKKIKSDICIRNNKEKFNVAKQFWKI